MHNQIQNEEKLKRYLAHRDTFRYDIIDVMKYIACKFGVRFSKGQVDIQKNTELEELIPCQEKVVFILLDGLGYYKLKELPEDSLLKQHLVTPIQTVNPTSTACILTSLYSASYPTEHGLFGWWQYDKSLDLNYYPLLFQGRKTNINLKERGVKPKDLYHFKSIFDQFNAPVEVYMNRNIVNSDYSQFSSGKKANRHGYYSVKEATDTMAKRLAEKSRLFQYLYIDGLDLASHIYGINSPEANDIIVALERGIQHIISQNPDVTVVVTADHGQVEMASMLYLNQNHDYSRYFYALPSIDTRMISFFVKEEWQAEFEKQFMQEFGEDVILLTRDEADDFNLFGEKSLSQEAENALGEYIAIVVNSKFMVCDKISYEDKMNTKGNHSGLTKYETTIPLVVLSQKR